MDNSTIRYHLGMAYLKNGNREEAKRELKRALDLNHKFPEAEEAKTTLQAIK